MPRSTLRVTQQWRRHFDAPVSLLRTSPESGDILAADEDGHLYMLDNAGRFLWTCPLDFIPVAVGLDQRADTAVALSADGLLVVFDRRGRPRFDKRAVWRPLSLDVAPAGNACLLVDGAGKVLVFDFNARKGDFLESRQKFHYAKFTASGSAFLAVGRYGQVMFHRPAEDRTWEKDFRCHTRLPSMSASGDLILIPSPHFGVIALSGDGADRGLFEVPHGPKCLAVSADGERIFVVNETNELIIFEKSGAVLFREPFGAGISHVEFDDSSMALTAVMTSGALERFHVHETRKRDRRFLEFSIQRADKTGAGPAVLFRSKVFSALGGPRGGTIALTPAARHVALLDIEGNLRIFDKTGVQTASAERIYGLQPSLKAGRSNDVIVAASSENLIAIDLRSYTQRRISVKNEWATHFDIAPNALFVAVADFFRGVSLFDEKLQRTEYFETDHDVLALAIDGNRRTLIAIADGSVALYSDHGSLITRSVYPTDKLTSLVGLGSGFAAVTKDIVDTFDREGNRRWSIHMPGEIRAVQVTRAGLVVTAVDGATHITNSHGTVINRMRRRADARYFSSPDDPKDIISLERQGRLLTARSTDKGVLWRREMDDDITAMEISADGSFVSLIAGINLYCLATAVGQKSPAERLYLEI